MAPRSGTPTAAPLTLRDTFDSLAIVESWIDEHADVILANGGALPPELEELLVAAEGSRDERIDARAAKIRQFQAACDVCKQEAARYSQRAKVWENAATALKEFTKRQLEAEGVTAVKTTRFSVRIQNNSAPSCAHEYTSADLLKIVQDDGLSPRTAVDVVELAFAHPLSRFITLQTVASLDTRALVAAYEAREVELRAEIAPLTADDLDETEFQQALDVPRLEGMSDEDYDAMVRASVARTLESTRRSYVATHLAREFPGVQVRRGTHLRIS